MAGFAGAFMSAGNKPQEVSDIGKITSTGNGGKRASMSSNGAELKSMVPVGPYGIASTPPNGVMAYAIKNTGSSTGFVIYDKDRPSVSAGNITIYNKSGTKIEVIGNKVTITGTNIKIKGDAEITGKLKVGGDTEVSGNIKIVGTSTFDNISANQSTLNSVTINGGSAILSSANIGGISFSNHKHTSSISGSDTSGPH